MEYELYHHGVKGQKWGVRRYQKKDGSLTPLGKMKYRTDKDFKRSYDRNEALKKARQAKAEKRQHEAEREQVIRSGSASELLKYKGELSPQEMNAAWQRIQWENGMKQIADKEVFAGKSKADKVVDTIGDLTDKSQKIIKAYNTVANINNALNPNMVMPKIDTDITKGNRKDYLDNRAERKKRKEEQLKQEQEAQAEHDKEAQREKERKKAERERKKAEKQEKREAERKAQEENKTYSGTVEGEGTSRYSGGSKSSTYDAQEGRDYWYANSSFQNTPTSNLPTVYESSGRDYVNNTYFLEDRNGR